jgi:hypothetical protein
MFTRIFNSGAANDHYWRGNEGSPGKGITSAFKCGPDYIFQFHSEFIGSKSRTWTVMLSEDVVKYMLVNNPKMLKCHFGRSKGLLRRLGANSTIASSYNLPK